MKGKYCCFDCAKKDYDEHDITDICDTPGCNYAYNFPLVKAPITITSDRGLVYNVIEPKGRGFYAATYLCTRGNLNTNTILKVTPQVFYEKVKSNVTKSSDAFEVFKNECLEHSAIAEGADQHIVRIDDFFKTDVDFAGVNISCFVAELRYIPGLTFDDYIHETKNITARNFAQLAIDLFTIWGILSDKLKYHNDLHGKNLIVEELNSSVRRIGELNSSIRLVAIDMNSTDDKNLSGINREGDQTHIYNHLLEMTRLLRDKTLHVKDTDDIDFRLVKTLEKLTSMIKPGPERNRHPRIEELIQMLKDDFNSNLSYAPWERPLALNSLEDGYNAQTIHKCYIPFLLVDPDNEWINDISISGPQIITGMRGCGKTTLLGALDFHSRAMWDTKSKKEQAFRLNADQYIGISASCSNLIDNRGKRSTDNFAKLIWLYVHELISIIRHLKSIDENLIIGDYVPKIVNLLKSLTTVDFTDITIEPSDSEFERYLSIKMQAFSEGGDGRLRTPPKDAFEALATMVMSLSTAWNNKKVFFLLDDASTRYLRVETITELFTNLLFQSSICSFKITTELQSVELMRVNSPGNIALAREGRDFTFYDFGSKVLEKFNSKNGGKSFLNDILTKRIKYFYNHPNKNPEQILGDITLEKIALNIASAKTANERSTIYHGISALAGFCVGDIGDVILLYDRIVRKYSGEIPVKSREQSECYQDLCSGRLYNLNRKSHVFNDNIQRYATSFAQASHFLLKKSKEDFDKEMKNYSENPDAYEKQPQLRLRQYSSLHVRITKDEDKQATQLKTLMDLVDAGIFVFDGKGGVPRAKNIGANPILQFKLAYRKLFGIASLIGLSDRDRFELSGNDLEEWLSNPNKEVLIRNLKGDTDPKNFNDFSTVPTNEEKDVENTVADVPLQMTLFTNFENLDKISNLDNTKREISNAILYPHSIDLKPFLIDKMKIYKTDIIISALGFEERSLESIKSILSIWKTKSIILIKYPEHGKTDQILAWLNSQGLDNKISIINYNELTPAIENIKKSTNCLLDITALSKPIIFKMVTEILSQKKKLVAAYTGAEEYYPREEIIKERFEANQNMPRYQQFDKIMDNLSVGEKTDKYTIIPQITESECFNTRPTVLFGFMVSKNQRILEMLEQKEYAWTELFAPSDDNYRSKLARMAADIAMSNYSNIETVLINHNNPKEIMNQLFERYNYFYANQGLNIEIALTGTKLQALACAALGSVEKVSQFWYVEPSEFDKDNFSKGAKDTLYYQLTRI